MEGPTNRPISEVHPHLRQCVEKISEFSGSIRSMLDAVVVASEGDNRGDVLTAWNAKDEIAMHKKMVIEAADRALDFTDSPHYKGLPKTNQVRYWNYLVRANNRFQILSERLKLYSLLSQIEHTEQTIDFLSNNYYSTIDYFLVLSNEIGLGRRGDKMYTERLLLLRKRIHREICELMNLLEDAIKHDAFETMDIERRELYHAKWRVYFKKIQQFSSN